jgi:hypothetical protein
MIQTNKKVNKTLLLNRKNIIFNISSLDFLINIMRLRESNKKEGIQIKCILLSEIKS